MFWFPTALLLRGRALALAVTALEALDAATGVNQLLLTGVEGVALGAQFDVHLRLRGAGDERVPA